VVQGKKLRNFRPSSFSTEGTTCIPRASITLGIDPHFSNRQHSAQRKAPVFKLLRGRFWGFSPRRATRCTDGSETWHWGRDRRSPLPCQISPHRCNDRGIGKIQNWNFYWDLIKMWNINAQQGR